MNNERTVVTMDSQMLTTFQTCPRKYYWAFIRSIEPVHKKNALSMGSIFHDLFEFVNKGLIEKKAELPYLVMEAVQSVNFGEVSVEDKVFITKRFMEYFEHWKIEDSYYQPITAEAGFSKILFENEDVVFIYEGRIDLLTLNKRDNTLVWRDYKTSSGHKLYHHTNQFLGYTWAMGESTAYGMLDYIGKQATKTDKTFEREIVKFHPNQVERWKERAIRTYWNFIIDINYEEHLSGCDTKYGLCGFTTLCERDPEIHEQLIQIKYQPKESWSAW